MDKLNRVKFILIFYWFYYKENEIILAMKLKVEVNLIK